MTILEQVTEMKKQRVPDEEIINELRGQGVSPKSINDALNQTKIKNAVVDEGGNTYNAPKKQVSTLQGRAKTQEIPDEGIYSPSPPEEAYTPQDYAQSQNYPSSQETIPYQSPPQDQNDSTYSPGFDTNTIIEISEQVFTEKIQSIQKRVDDFSEFKTLTESKTENLSERVKRMETMIDKLQIAILDKISFYGSNLEGVKKEMSMVRDSFSKMINPLAERAEKAKPNRIKTTGKNKLRKNN